MADIPRRMFLYMMVGAMAGIAVLKPAAKVLEKIVAKMCVWNMGTSCEGEVEKRLMFQGQIEIPICDKHFHEHKIVMALHEKGEDVEEVLEMSAKEREERAKKLGLSDEQIEETKA